MICGLVVCLSVLVWLFPLVEVRGQTMPRDGAVQPAGAESGRGKEASNLDNAQRTEERDGTSPSPAARYSPLAASGRYRPSAATWYDAVFISLNPKQIHWGEWWEGRRRLWLDNVALNPYFWYSFAATTLLVVSWFALAVFHSDRLKERRRWAELTADAKHYAESCRRQALEAICRYNAHVEKCNRVIESAESGLVTPETANLKDMKRELERLRADNDAKTRQVERLDEQLKQRDQARNDLVARIGELEKRLGSGKRGTTAAAVATATNGPPSTLMERINRLEKELAERNQQIRKLKGG